MLYTPGRVTHANANIILDNWYFSKKSNSRTFEEIQTNQQEIYEICKLLGHLNISRKSIFRKSENHWSYMYVVFRKKYFLWPISESELQRGFFMIPLEGFGPVVTFCSFVVMIRVVWARVVIEGIWGCYAVLRSKVLSLSWSLRNVKLIFQEHLGTCYAQT